MDGFAFTKQQKLQQSLSLINKKLGAGIPLTPEEHRLASEVERVQRLKLKLEFRHEDGKMHVRRTGDADPVFAHVRHLSQLHAETPSHKKTKKFLGSIDPITAAQFRKEVGAGVGTQEFQDYALKKLNTTHTKFKADK